MPLCHGTIALPDTLCLSGQAHFNVSRLLICGELDTVKKLLFAFSARGLTLSAAWRCCLQVVPHFLPARREAGDPFDGHVAGVRRDRFIRQLYRRMFWVTLLCAVFVASFSVALLAFNLAFRLASQRQRESKSPYSSPCLTVGMGALLALGPVTSSRRTFATSPQRPMRLRGLEAEALRRSSQSSVTGDE